MGVLVPVAQAGKLGSGSFKVSPAEKLRLKQAEKAAAMKVILKEKKTTDTKKAAKKGTKKVAKQSAKKTAKKSSAGKKSTGLASKKVSAKKTSKVSVKSKKTAAKPKKVKK